MSGEITKKDIDWIEDLVNPKLETSRMFQINGSIRSFLQLSSDPKSNEKELAEVCKNLILSSIQSPKESMECLDRIAEKHNKLSLEHLTYLQVYGIYWAIRSEGDCKPTEDKDILNAHLFYSKLFSLL